MAAEAAEKLYYRIGEVEAITGVPAYVLRYWESEFKLLRPKKNAAGQRLYRHRDLDLVKRIKTLLYDERLTLEGAKKRLLAESRKGPEQLELGHAGGLVRGRAAADPRAPDRAAGQAQRGVQGTRVEGPRASARIRGEVGAWRSPVAHMTGGHGVGGSNPLAPTI